MTLALRLETGIFLISFQAFYTVLNVRENRLSAKLITITSWTLSAFGVFLVRIFPHLNWIWRDTPYLFVFSPNAEKYGPEKLRIQALFTSWIIPDQLRIIWKYWTTATHFYLKASKNKILGDFDEEIFDLNSASFSLSITLKNANNSTCIGLILTNCPNHF